MLLKRNLWFAVLFLCCSVLAATKSYAEMLPRLAYVVPATDGTTVEDSFLGEYWYLGVGFFDSSGGGWTGPSVRYGFGDTGKKLNVSYLVGGGTLSLEGGVSYFRQDVDASLLIDPTYEGFAFEATLRYGISNAIFITTGDVTSFEIGLGF